MYRYMYIYYYCSKLYLQMVSVLVCLWFPSSRETWFHGFRLSMFDGFRVATEPPVSNR